MVAKLPINFNKIYPNKTQKLLYYEDVKDMDEIIIGPNETLILDGNHEFNDVNFITEE